MCQKLALNKSFGGHDNVDVIFDAIHVAANGLQNLRICSIPTNTSGGSSSLCDNLLGGRFFKKVENNTNLVIISNISTKIINMYRATQGPL